MTPKQAEEVETAEAMYRSAKNLESEQAAKIRGEIKMLQAVMLG